jgi:hypothetical protein
MFNRALTDGNNEMNDIVKIIGGRSVEQFDPERYRLNHAALDYTIEEAKRLQEWPALETAVSEKIKEQQSFVAWWKSKVRRPGGDRQSKKKKALLQTGNNAHAEGRKCLTACQSNKPPSSPV